MLAHVRDGVKVVMEKEGKKSWLCRKDDKWENRARGGGDREHDSGVAP